MEEHNIFTPAERSRLIKEYFDALQAIEDYAVGKWGGRVVPTDRNKEKDRENREKLSQAAKEYKAGVPIIPLSRCPICQPVMHLSIDYYDLDGLWWWSELPMRPKKQEKRCPHYWILSGAVLLGTIPPTTRWVRPGPEVPFVSPEALRNPTIKAVLTQISVGTHIAYPIVYFSAEKPIEIGRPFPEWSNQDAVWIQESGREQYETPGYDESIADFDLVPWIQQGQLLWIAPGDESLTLRSDVDGCPYLNLPGQRKFLRLTGKGLWEAPHRS
jgi:hypothetical protein